MTLGVFNQPIEILRPEIEVSFTMSSIYSSKNALSIISKPFLHCFLRYINGDRHLDIRLVAWMSKALFYRCVNLCLRAICNRASNDLDINFGVNPLTILRRQKQSAALSSHRIIRNCIECIESIFILTKSPSDAPNTPDYYSGHYCKYCINVQAFCEHAYRFTFTSIAGPGASSDLICYKRGSLNPIMENVPTSIFTVGENAYPASEYLLTYVLCYKPIIYRTTSTNDISVKCGLQLNRSLRFFPSMGSS